MSIFQKLKDFFTVETNEQPNAKLGVCTSATSEDNSSKKAFTATPTKAPTCPRFHVIPLITSSVVVIAIMLVIRELFPSVGNALGPVYAFLDNVLIPVTNWAYALITKLVTWLTSFQWISDILSWINNLAY